MEPNLDASSGEPRGELLAAWEDAFSAPKTWRESFADGIRAVGQLLEADRRIIDTCVLASLPVSTGGRLVWHREIVRARVAEIMHDKWRACGEPEVPRLHFEVLLGEICTLVRERERTGASYADLPDAVLAMSGK